MRRLVLPGSVITYVVQAGRPTLPNGRPARAINISLPCKHGAFTVNTVRLTLTQ
jgi:hypothetical protein